MVKLRNHQEVEGAVNQEDFPVRVWALGQWESATPRSFATGA